MAAFSSSQENLCRGSEEPGSPAESSSPELSSGLAGGLTRGLLKSRRPLQTVDSPEPGSPASSTGWFASSTSFRRRVQAPVADRQVAASMRTLRANQRRELARLHHCRKGSNTFSLSGRTILNERKFSPFIKHSFWKQEVLLLQPDGQERVIFPEEKKKSTTALDDLVKCENAVADSTVRAKNKSLQFF